MSELKYATPEDLQHSLADLRVIDLREPEEYHGPQGHLPGSELVPLALLPQEMGHWSTDRPLLLVGPKAPQAGALLLSRGFEVTVLEGGVKAWLAAGMRARRTHTRALVHRAKQRRWVTATTGR